MTLTQAIAICDELRPGNKWDNDLKTRWINEVQGRIHVMIHMTALRPLEEYQLEYPHNPGDIDPELDVPTPYDRLYWLYLVAMVDFSNSDWQAYENSYALYNDVLKEYKKYYISTFEPGRRRLWDKEAERNVNVPTRARWI